MDQDKADGLEAGAEIDDAVPHQLTPEGRDVWTRIVPPLKRAGRIKATDLEAITRYCDMVGSYWKMSKQIAEEGSTMLVPTVAKDDKGEGAMWRRHPLLSERRAMAKALEGIEDRFGMSPRARADLVNRQLGRAPPEPGELPLEGGGMADGEQGADPAAFN
ncbi:MAG: phage terminase small subunit P27 family [Hyphomonas sp.]|uniref:phage terminase small subunit P27 family n=1 Tax=Hyphomonas sp. TaxID=87 RepID=UPI0025BFC38D|nr:phage terminase small subunit P27 family [Hyphomonas sp.]MBA4338328.1 phage terminase small subunit P27 family [Hyphomonas sp.]